MRCDSQPSPANVKPFNRTPTTHVTMEIHFPPHIVACPYFFLNFMLALAEYIIYALPRLFRLIFATVPALSFLNEPTYSKIHRSTTGR